MTANLHWMKTFSIIVMQPRHQDGQHIDEIMEYNSKKVFMVDSLKLSAVIQT